MLVVAACDAPGQTQDFITALDSDSLEFNYAVTDDSIVLRRDGRLEELDLDGAPRGTLFDQPFIKMTAGHGWVAWSDVVDNMDGTFSARFWRRNRAGTVEQVTSTMANSTNIDALVATPDGIVIRPTYDGLIFWGATSLVPLGLGDSSIWPFTFDSGWLYASSGELGGTDIVRYRLDGSERERVVSYQGPSSATSFAVRGTRFVYVTNDFPTSAIRLLDLDTHADRALGEVSYGYSYAPIAVDDTYVFAGRYRYDGDLEPFLPPSENVRRLEIVGDQLYYSVQPIDENGYPGATELYRASASGEPLVTPPGDDDSRPPWL